MSSYKYTAIMIEPRNHPALEFVLNNFTTNLNNKWQFIIFHGTSNYEFVLNIVNKLSISNDRITLINLNVENLSIHEYNNLLKNIHFYEHIPTETFLIFQTDTLINPKYKNLINEFIQFDYVGAPWKFNDQVGNGGLSLRKKSKMIDIIKTKKFLLNFNGHFFELNKNTYNNAINLNEDVYFSLNNFQTKINVNGSENIMIVAHDTLLNKPDFEFAKKFSCETIFSEIHFGIHKAYGYCDLNLLYEHFPQALELGKLNGDERCIEFLQQLDKK